MNKLATHILQTLFLLVVRSAAAAGAAMPGDVPLQERELLTTTDLENGAEVGVHLEIDDPASKGGLPLTPGLPIAFYGNASVGLGVPDVSYIYILDESGSTSEADAPCNTTLECVQDFFYELHEEILDDGSAELVAVIRFDSDVVVTDWFNPHDPANADVVQDALDAAYPSQLTNCSGALFEAAALVNSTNNTAGTTIVVFAGDGLCDAWNVSDAADALGATGAIVHTVAVGGSVNCTDSLSSHNELADIPRNGGTCISVPDPHTLPRFVDDIIGTNLTALEYKIDDGDYMDVTTLFVANNSQPVLPLEGSVLVQFSELLSGGLEEGSHEICVRATAVDTLGDNTTQVEECHQVSIDPTPTMMPTVNDVVVESRNKRGLEGWEVFLVVAGVFLGVTLFVVGTRMFLYRDTRESEPKDLQLEAKEEATEDDGKEAEPKSVV